ncbi:MAG TPA: ABC transporter ATP-binding protein [Clostridia bacterium]|nr:ABC transporter ATP-binding protein [Clostridia bacterium]
MREQKPPALARLLADNRRHWARLAWLTGLMLLSGLFKSWAADAFGKTVDAGALGLAAQALRWGAAVLVLYLLDAARLAVFNVETVRVVDGMFLDIKARVFEHIARAQMSAFESALAAGDLVARMTGDLSKLQRIFSETFTWLISVFFRGIIALIFCLTLSWQLSAVYLVLLPVTIVLMNRIGKPIQAHKKQASRSGGRAYSILAEVMNNLSVVKAFGAETVMDERFGKAMDEQTDQLIRSERQAMRLSLAAYLGDVIQLGLIFLLGAYLVSQGLITVGALVTFIALTGSIREAFELAEKGISSAREGAAAAERVYEVLDLPSEARDGTLPLEGPVAEAKALRFRYDAEPVLEDITLRLNQGGKIALVGPSGCGKSTLAKLLCRLYDGYEGELTLFGRNAAQIDPAALRRRVAMVAQDAYLFSGSIADNVRHGRPDATDLEVEEVLRAVRLWDFVESLPEGMRTPVGDFGARLSGGQKQRLAIARALIRHAELILLDEATSALDTQTEQEIQEMLARLFADKSVVVIAHRFAALRDVEYVYCLEKGRVVEQGSRAELLSRDGYLSRMAKAQETA